MGKKLQIITIIADDDDDELIKFVNNSLYTLLNVVLWSKEICDTQQVTF